MSTTDPPLLELEVHRSLWDCLQSCGLPAIEERGTQMVAETLAEFGVRVAPTFALRESHGERAIRALVDGVEQPLPPSFAARLWFGIAPGDVRDRALDPAQAQRDGGQGWLLAIASSPDRERMDIRQAVCDLVAHLAVEVVALHPGSLLSETEAADRLGVASLTPAQAAAILRTLLALGVSISDDPAVSLLVGGACDLGLSPDDAAEETLAGLCAPDVEIRVDDRTFDALVHRPDDADRVALDESGVIPTLVEAMRLVTDVQLRRLGVAVPVVLVRAPGAVQPEMQVKINDRLGPPVPLPGRGEVGVSAPPAVLEEAGLRGARGLVDPVAGAHLSAVPDHLAEAVSGAGYVPVLPGSYLAGSFGRIIGALGYRLITVDRVEAMLAHFEEVFSGLVHTALARYSMFDLTRLLRAMVRERVAIDDLWRILNVLVLLPQDESREAVPANRLEHELARVRAELGNRIVVESCRIPAIGGPMRPTVFETERAFEERVERWHDAEPPDLEKRTARQAVWNALAANRGFVEPVILTSASARSALREALGHEFADVHVLSREEVPADVIIEPVGSVRAVPD